MRLGGWVVDLAPARHSRAFRLVLLSRTIVLLSAGFIAVAIPVQVYDLTRSSLHVGLVSLTLGLSLLAGFIAGGVLADRMERRRLILISSAGVAAAFAVLAVNAAISSPHQLWVIYLTAAIGGAVEGLGETALSAVTPAIVGADQLVAASGLLGVTSQLGAVAGPALGGALLAAADLTANYAAAAVAIAAATTLLVRLPPLPPAVQATEDPGPLRSVIEGWTFVRTNRLIAGVLLIDSCVTVFGVPATLFPQLVHEVFDGGPELVGMLAAAPAAGALVASVASGWTGRVRRPGAVLFAAVLFTGLSYIGFGLSSQLVPALFFLGLAGASDSVSEILRRALLQHHTPDHLQGRVQSLWLAQASTSYSFGGVASGGASRLVGPSAAIVGAGVVCLVGVLLLAVRLPELRAATLGVPVPREAEVTG